MTVRSVTRVVMASTCLVFVGTSGALAQEKGVTVDPNSPTGKEYALPVDSARQSGSTGRGEQESGAGDVPATTGQRDDAGARFGAGIGSDRESGDRRSGTRSSGDRTDRRESGTSTTPDSTDRGGGRDAPAASASPPTRRTDEAGLPITGVAIAVLAAGVLAGGVARWRRGPR